MGVGSSFEPIPGTRHRVELVDGVECIVAPAGRNWFVLLFLGFWLTMWTMGGFAAMVAVTSNTADAPFLLVWFAAWACGWVFAASTVGWQLAGRTLVSVNGGALVYRWAMPLVSRTRRYDATQVRRLRAAASPALPFGMSWGMRDAYPPFFRDA